MILLPVFLTLLSFSAALVPREYEEMDDLHLMIFTVTSPVELAYTFQMKQTYLLGSRFKQQPNTTMKDINLVLADPPLACEKLNNKFFVPTAVLVLRGKCSFTEKVNNARDSGAALIMVTEIDVPKPPKTVIERFAVWLTEGMPDFESTELVSMIPDSSLRIVDVPCVYVAGVTGRRFRDHLVKKKTPIRMNIPVEPTTTRWFYSRRTAPWENWEDEYWHVL